MSKSSTSLTVATGSDRSLCAKRIPFQEIPLVSLKGWYEGSPLEKKAVAEEINTICRNVGFMYLSDHGIANLLIDEVFEASKKFFSLSEQEKDQVHFRNSGYHRGYIPLGGESTDPKAKADMKESFDCGLICHVDIKKYPGAAARAMAPNQSPENMPYLQTLLESYLQKVTELSRTIFQIWAYGFGLERNFFQNELTSPIAQLRLMYYPPSNGMVDSNYLGIGTHCDYEALTILAQDDIGGLEVKNSDGDWIEATPVKGTFVINIGEMMARWTNDCFVATPHRVINRAPKARYSIPFFFATNYDTVVRCLPSCMEEREARYEPVIAGEYLAERLKEIYGV